MEIQQQSNHRHLRSYLNFCANSLCVGYHSKTMTTSEVQSLYERRPYPHYPLLAKPRWQDGYLGSSLFAAALSSQVAQGTGDFLSVGCGEILPYIIRKWEPQKTSIHCVDLSRRSLNRAKFRCITTSGTTNFYQADINELLVSEKFQQKKFKHIEAYGVLHHIPTLDQTIELLAQHLTDNGTMRIMVYNAHARNWIWDLNRSFRLMGLNYDRDQDIATARKLLYELAKHSPRLAQHLRSMGTKSLANDTRFADTFMHPWEARLDLKRWLELFSGQGLEPFALYDRYGELDDLANPLWKMPTTQALTERAHDFRFENNLEIWLRRPLTQSSTHTKSSIPRPLSLRTRMPPSQWNRFPETKNLSFKATFDLWQGWQKSVYAEDNRDVVKLIRTLSLPTAQRLARIGAILSIQAEDACRYDELMKPMVQRVDAPDVLVGMKDTNLMSLLSSSLPISLTNQIIRRWQRL